MGKYFKIYGELLKMNYMRAMEYRIDFISTLLPTLIYSVGYLIFLNVILSKVPTIGGWDTDKMLLIFSLEQLDFYLAWIFYKRSLEVFFESIRDGSFDFVVKLPFSTRFITSFKEHALDVVLPAGFAVFLLIYSLRNTVVSIPILLLAFVLFLCGAVILYNLTFAVAAIAFWTVDAKDLTDLMDDVTSFSRYPAEVYPGPIVFLLSVVIPVMMLAYVPATALLSALNWRLGGLSVVMVGVTYLVSDLVWKKGLRHYSSASS